MGEWTWLAKNKWGQHIQAMIYQQYPYGIVGKDTEIVLIGAKIFDQRNMVERDLDKQELLIVEHFMKNVENFNLIINKENIDNVLTKLRNYLLRIITVIAKYNRNLPITQIKIKMHFEKKEDMFVYKWDDKFDKAQANVPVIDDNTNFVIYHKFDRPLVINQNNRAMNIFARRLKEYNCQCMKAVVDCANSQPQNSEFSISLIVHF